MKCKLHSFWETFSPLSLSFSMLLPLLLSLSPLSLFLSLPLALSLSQYSPSSPVLPTPTTEERRCKSEREREMMGPRHEPHVGKRPPSYYYKVMMRIHLKQQWNMSDTTIMTRRHVIVSSLRYSNVVHIIVVNLAPQQIYANFTGLICGVFVSDSSSIPCVLDGARRITLPRQDEEDLQLIQGHIK